MLLNNPNYKPPLTKTETRLEVLQPIISDYISKLPANVQQVPFDDIRAYVAGLNYSDKFGKLVPAELTDAIIMFIADKNGLTYV